MDSVREGVPPERCSAGGSGEGKALLLRPKVDCEGKPGKAARRVAFRKDGLGSVLTLSWGWHLSFLISSVLFASHPPQPFKNPMLGGSSGNRIFSRWAN